MTAKEIFFCIYKENERSLQPGHLVTCKILSYYQNIYNATTLNGINCLIFDVKKTKKLLHGQILKASIKEIDYEKPVITLSIEQSDLKNHRSNLEKLYTAKQRENFTIIESQDFPKFYEEGYQEKLVNRIRLNHPKFKFMSFPAAMQFLQNKATGDFVIRPSY